MNFSRKLNSVLDFISFQSILKKNYSQVKKIWFNSEQRVAEKEEHTKEWFNSLDSVKQYKPDKPHVKFSELNEADKIEFIKKMWKERLVQSASAPKELTQDYLNKLVKRDNSTQLRKTFEYLAKREYYQEKSEKKKALRKKQMEETLDKDIDNRQSKLFLRRIGSNDYTFFYRHRLISAIMDNAPQIVFDHRFTPSQTREEAVATMFRQYIEIVHYNREESLNPFKVLSFHLIKLHLFVLFISKKTKLTLQDPFLQL
jgi:hypothetical protein